ncbi:MAG: helix-turn-helix domain-containing protein, partial [Pseudomonadota bacterium]
MKFQEFMNKSHLMALYQDYNQHFLPLLGELKKRDLNLHQALILFSIFFENQLEISPKLIEKTLGIPKDRISQALASLEKKQLIQRELGKEDRRLRILKLSNHGKKTCSELVALFDRFESLYETFLGDQKSSKDLLE